MAYECGLYAFSGTVREKDHKLLLVANEKSNSEVNLFFDVKMETKFVSFINRPITVEVGLLKKFDGKNGFIADANRPELRVPNPTKGALDTYFNLIKKMECKE